MNILNDIFNRRKKRCIECGCILYNDSDSEICECCVDDMNDDEEEVY